MSLPGPVLPSIPPTGPRPEEWYTPQYLAWEQPDRPVEGRYTNRYCRNPNVLAVIGLTLLALAVAFFVLDRL